MTFPRCVNHGVVGDLSPFLERNPGLAGGDGAGGHVEHGQWSFAVAIEAARNGDADRVGDELGLTSAIGSHDRGVTHHVHEVEGSQAGGRTLFTPVTDATDVEAVP